MSGKAVIFDLDGTLLNTLYDLSDSVNYTMRTFSSPEITLAQTREFVGNGAADLIAKSIKGGRSNPDFDRALEFYKKYYDTHADIKTCPYEGVIGLLTKLRERNIGVAVVTNKPDYASNVLCKKYFGDLVIQCVGDREGMARKPAPDKVYAMMEMLECEKAVFVGDSEVDVKTAQNAGLECICMTWGFRDRDVLEAAGGDVFCDNADELWREILRALGEEDM